MSSTAIPLPIEKRESRSSLSAAERERYDANYASLFGVASSKARLRWAIAGRHGRADIARLVEDLRVKVIHENAVGTRVQQLVHFGQLLVLGNRLGAESHAQAALRAGAEIGELLGVVETALITSGIGAYSTGIEIVAALDHSSSSDDA